MRLPFAGATRDGRRSRGGGFFGKFRGRATGGHARVWRRLGLERKKKVQSGRPRLPHPKQEGILTRFGPALPKLGSNCLKLPSHIPTPLFLSSESLSFFLLFGAYVRSETKCGRCGWVSPLIPDARRDDQIHRSTEPDPRPYGNFGSNPHRRCSGGGSTCPTRPSQGCPLPSLSVEAALANAPAQSNDLILVPKIVE